MKVVVKGSFESSKVMIRGRTISSKRRLTWRGRAFQVYIKFTKKLISNNSVV